MESSSERMGADSPREAELHEVLASYVEPRAVSYGFVIAFVVLGLAGCVWMAWAVSRAPTQIPLRFERGASEALERGIAAFRRGDWDEAEHLLSQARQMAPEAALRLDDYLERLALIRRDQERLARAEAALAQGDLERALAFAGLIGPGSPLHDAAELLTQRIRTAQQPAPRGAPSPMLQGRR